ncbi:MetQ/NlpA family ABC transporter substrate-binding protein [Streptococcus uberis]|uniref:MetQ/NlpA family ABC transporter substrate-binding protein n=1 Tax=Streptococcus uberis TaxID=1349 RepID=UPI001FF29456|nr:MetQ/NlpA family ABC transporter substrate-binding protein [Streptococcus uberis]MCK1215676.1 MetQ/NlpA family ABC transporter substrate-binding protein [Streptococcus uberis]
MSYKKILGLIGLTLVSSVLVACGSDQNDNKTLTVGVMTKTSSDDARWKKIESLLKKDGIKLKYKEFTDYSQPNKAVANGEVDINAFQHYNFLNNWNKENKENLVSIADTYISPIHLFSGTTQKGKAKYTSVEDLPKGAQIAIPNDATNESRALYVLQSAGLIKLNVSGDKLATIANVTENKKDLDIKELDASQTARSLTSADAAIVNNSYAVPAKIDYKTSLYKENVDQNSKQWVNILAGKKDWEKSDKEAAIKKLVKAYHTDELKKVVEDTSEGIDVPVW